MPWVRFEPTLHSHPKVVALSDGAFRLWTASVSWAVANLTDGAIPPLDRAAHPLRRALGLGVVQFKRRAVELLDAGLWESNGTGVVIHDFLDFQPTRADVEREREQNRERVKRWRARNAVSDGVSNGARTPLVTQPERAKRAKSTSPTQPQTPSRPSRRRPGPRKGPATACPICGLVGVHEAGCAAAGIGDE